MFVVATDFDEVPYSIPKLAESNSFADFVTEQEENILRKILGNALYDDFIEGRAEVYPLQKWTDLEDGASYTWMQKEYKWVGMRKLLIPFIFASWTRETTIYPTGIGIIVPSAENAQVITSSYKVSKAWNEFAIKAGLEDCWDYDVENTLYGFLKANLTDYADANGLLHYCSPGTMNIFNL